MPSTTAVSTTLPMANAWHDCNGDRGLYYCARPRDLNEIREEIADALEGLTDMRAHLKMAGQGIKSRGMYLPIKTTNNQGDTVERDALNPAFKVQREAMTAIKNIKRFLVLLREEEQIAQRAEKPAVGKD